MAKWNHLECGVAMDPPTAIKFLRNENLKHVTPINESVTLFYFKSKDVVVDTPYYIGVSTTTSLDLK